MPAWRAAQGGQLERSPAAWNPGSLHAKPETWVPIDIPMASCRAFFPLSTQTLQSFPLAAYSSVSSQASVAPDPLFGSVLECNQQDFDMASI